MRTVLVVRLSSLGDIVLTQPVLAAIGQAGDGVDLCVKPEYAPLARMLPGATRVLTSAAELAPAYPLALDLHGTGRARRLLRAARAQRVVRYSKRALARRLLVRPGGRRVFWNRWSSLRAPESVTAWYAAAAARAGYAVPAVEPRLEIPAAAQAQARVLLQELGAGGRFAALAPGAKWPTKQWPPEYFGRLAARLDRESKLAPVFVGSAAESGLCQNAALAAGGRAVSAAGRTEAPVLAALLGAAEVLVCNDSGPLHLGLAAGTKAVAFFGPTVRQFGFMPRGPRVRVLSLDLPCRPCSLHGGRRCPLGHHRCLRNITPDEAFEAVRELLGKGRKLAK